MKAAEKHVVIISREWHNPEIKIDVVDSDASPFNGIAISMRLPDYISALCAELGADGDLAAKIDAAMDRVCAKMKRESVQVM